MRRSPVIIHKLSSVALIFHYSQDDKLILVEILDFRRLVSTETISELLTA